MTSDKTPDGINCCKCQHYMPFSAWVFAHWHEELFSECPKCSTRHSIRQGVARIVGAKRSADQRRQDLREAADEHGYELIKSDLRSGYFHIRKGTEVRQGYISRNAADAGPAMNKAVKSGMRLDQTELSEYYVGRSDG